MIIAPTELGFRYRWGGLFKIASLQLLLRRSLSHFFCISARSSTNDDEFSQTSKAKLNFLFSALSLRENSYYTFSSFSQTQGGAFECTKSSLSFSQTQGCAFEFAKSEKTFTTAVLVLGMHNFVFGYIDRISISLFIIAPHHKKNNPVENV